ncbi:S8 family serine peptidase, partial [Candidatus Woesearchaeota archaeon]|nr:S8 family serine peptidase [Candidatus Woesearchaeota archaeon]
MRSSCIFCTKILLLFGLLCMLSASAPAASVDKAVEQTLDSDEEVKVIIKLKDVPVPPCRAAGLETAVMKRSMIRSQQEKVKQKHKGLEVRHSYSTVNAMSTKITRAQLKELRDDPDVEAVFYDRVLHVSLDASIPQIDADNAWALQLDGYNLTGAGETICIVDTGIDYSHAALGGCSITRIELNGTNETYSLESAHPYADDFEQTWKITKPGYENIAVHFKNLTTESNYDYVKVADSSGNLIAILSGSHDDEWSPHADGDTIYLTLDTDSSVTDYGFVIDHVINGTTNKTYNWSSCPKVIGGWDVVNGDGDPMDDEKHGTHCAGIAASTDPTYRGVAPDANLIAMKVLDSSGSGTTSDIIAGIEWCTNRSSEYNISVISMSLGCNGAGCTHYQTYCNADPMAVAVDAAVDAGIAVTIASGNQGWSDGITYPACI